MIELIFRRFAGVPFKLEQVAEAAAGRTSGAELRAAVPGLLRRGELAAVKKTWGEKLYYIPADLLFSMWERTEPPILEPVDGRTVQLQKEAGPGLAVDVFRALAWIGKNGLPVTSKGTIHQKSVSKLAEYIYLQEEDVAGLGLRYPHPEVYPAQLAVVLDQLQALGLIAKERAGWQLNPHKLSAWLELDSDSMDTLLFCELLRRYVPEDTAIMHVVHRLALHDLQEGSWYSMGELYASLHTLGMLPDHLSERFCEWTRSWLRALAGFGWLDIGSNSEGNLLLRWRHKPAWERLRGLQESEPTLESVPIPISTYRARSGVIYVQPDFEVLVPPDVSYRVRWELEACCDNQTLDVMSVYRISRASVTRAFGLGRSPEAVLKLLEAHSAGIPDNVRLVLDQWAGELGRTTMVEKLLLRCADEEAAETVAALSSLNGIVERIGPRDFIVDTEQAAKVRKVLEEVRLSLPKQPGPSGSEPIFPKLGEAGMALALSDWEGSAAEQAWIISGRELHFYNKTTKPPGSQELFPGRDEIPGMWMKELRTYHASTARKIIAQAIAWKAKVSLRMDGSIAEFIPIALHGEEKWTVSGCLFHNPTGQSGVTGVETSLAPEQWDAMRLLLPEIS